jgi:hypothetical protein
MRVGVRNSDYHCDLRLRKCSPPVGDAPIGPLAGTRGAPAREARVDEVLSLTHSGPAREAARALTGSSAPQAVEPKARCSLPWRLKRFLATLRRGIAQALVKHLIGLSDPHRPDFRSVFRCYVVPEV